MTTTRTTCPYCGVGCGVLATPQPDGTVAIAGDPDHPANFGRLCSKGAALGETLALDGRLTQPLISGAPASWDGALQRIADTFAQTIATHGPDSVALYVSGQFLTEDYYVANKLMKGFIGTANIDTNSRLCMSSSVAGHRRAFGSDTVPGSYTDLEEADLVVLVGSNLAWCHPVLFQRLAAARERRGTKVVVIDPRRTATSEIADLHLSLAPDSDVDLFAGLLAHLARTGTLDRAYIDRHTNGLTEALAAIGGLAPAEVAEACGLSLRDVDRFFELFATTEKVVTVYSQGVNQSVRGSDKVNAIINCHLATGRIGRPGMGPLSATGQPNAMGGREVGGLANMLAAHMDLDNPEHRERVQRFWASPTIADRPGLKAIDLFRAVADGKVKAIWIMATNPVVSMPEADLVKAALKACPFVVVSDVTHTDTTALAHVLLPAAAWGEKSGTVTNSERRISRQRAFLDLPGEARPDWWALAQVARRMGFAGFDYAGPADIYREHAALSTFENEGNRDFDIGADAAIGTAGYDALAPFQWPAPAGQPKGETRFFAQGGFYTPDRKARFVATPPGVPKTDMAKTGDTDGLILNTGRIRDHWHTMTRTGKTARLMAHIGEPFCEIAPRDAERLDIRPADLVRVANDCGAVILRALITPRQREGSVFVPIHWSDQFAARARVGILVDPATDPVSGQPGSKNSRVTVARHAPAWHGFLISADRPNLDGLPYWAIARSDAGWRAELAGDSETEGWEALARRRIPAPASADSVAYHDAPAGVHRIALVAGDRLVGALFISPQPVAVAREVIASRLGTQMAGRDRLALLAGRAGANRPDPGATVCACFAVGINQILGAVRTGEATSVEAIGACLKAGTNCGSCRSEIGRLIQSELPQAAE